MNRDRDRGARKTQEQKHGRSEDRQRGRSLSMRVMASSSPALVKTRLGDRRSRRLEEALRVADGLSPCAPPGGRRHDEGVEEQPCLMTPKHSAHCRRGLVTVQGLGMFLVRCKVLIVLVTCLAFCGTMAGAQANDEIGNNMNPATSSKDENLLLQFFCREMLKLIRIFSGQVSF